MRKICNPRNLVGRLIRFTEKDYRIMHDITMKAEGERIREQYPREFERWDKSAREGHFDEIPSERMVGGFGIIPLTGQRHFLIMAYFEWRYKK